MLYGESAPCPRREGGGRKLFVGLYEFVRAVEKSPLTPAIVLRPEIGANVKTSRAPVLTRSQSRRLRIDRQTAARLRTCGPRPSISECRGICSESGDRRKR